MSLADIVKLSIEEVADIDVVGDGILVTTQCLYPSNAFVQVLVRGGSDEFVASDDGGMVEEIVSAGVAVSNPHKTLRHLIPHGLTISDRGVIASPVVSRELLGLTIVAVANAAKDAAQWHFDNLKIRRNRDFKRMLADFLDRRYDTRVRHHEVIIGESNTPHKFENVVLSDGRRVVIDPVLHEANSINGRVVAHYDVKQAKHPDVEQRLVIDDEDEWTPANVNLLSVGAIVVPFSQLQPVLARIGAD